MKKLILVITAAAFVFISCNSNSSNTEDHSKMNHNDSMPMQDNAMADKDVKMVTATFSNVDPALGAMKGFDKSLLTAEQKKVYDDIESDLKEHAEHIAKSKIDHQREHFSTMSTDVYDLVKAFGAGMTLYHDHCPMANDNKGAMWLSESKDIRNPYFGEKMMTCGSVKEMFR